MMVTKNSKQTQTEPINPKLQGTYICNKVNFDRILDVIFKKNGALLAANDHPIWIPGVSRRTSKCQVSQYRRVVKIQCSYTHQLWQSKLQVVG